MIEREFKIKAYQQKELTNMYGVSEFTFRSWLKPFRSEIGIQLGKYYTPSQVKIIVSYLGLPF